MQNLMKKKYKVNQKEQKQSMNEGVNELTSEAVLEKHVNITDEQASFPQASYPVM
jgi:hypothetical protein